MIGHALMMIPLIAGCSGLGGGAGAASASAGPDDARTPVAGTAAPAVPDTSSVTRGRHTEAAGTRAWRLALPPGGEAPAPLLVLLHGCTQDAEDVARGTRMDTLAGSRGVAVLYPEQDPAAHPLRCWNWYEPAHQGRDAGEPVILAGMIRAVVREHALDPDRVFVAGMSAGGAMAAILAATYPELMVGMASHSGVPFGIARGLPAATAALSGTLEVDPDAAAEAVRSAMGDRARRIPLLVIHGTTDAVVSPRNALWFREQGTRLLAPPGPGPGSIRLVTGAERATTDSPVELDSEIWTLPAQGPPLVRIVHVTGLGHAWSGGAPEGTYTDPRGPNASRMILDFMREVLPGGGP